MTAGRLSRLRRLEGQARPQVTDEAGRLALARLSDADLDALEESCAAAGGQGFAVRPWIEGHAPTSGEERKAWEWARTGGTLPSGAALIFQREAARLSDREDPPGRWARAAWAWLAAVAEVVEEARQGRGTA